MVTMMLRRLRQMRELCCCTGAGCGRGASRRASDAGAGGVRTGSTAGSGWMVTGRAAGVTAAEVAVEDSPFSVAVTRQAIALPASASVSVYVLAVAPAIGTPSRSQAYVN